jgi:hypothetical protein
VPFNLREDGKPVVAFDPRLEISPFALFRRLDEGRELLLVDIRVPPAGGKTLAGAERLAGDDWQPPAELDVVLFDDDGSAAVELAARLIEAGHQRVRALFGGLELYEFSLDPQVVGAKTYLVAEDEVG